MSKRYNKLSKLLGVLIIAFILSNFIPTKYYIMSPGVAQELSTIITVEEGFKEDITGDFLLTAVSSTQASLWDIFYLKITQPKGVRLEAIEEQFPTGIDINEYLEIMAQLMEESKLQAQAIAFKQAGFKVEVTGDGAEIVEFLETTKAKEVLAKGDIIKAINGQEVFFANDAVNLIRDFEIGEEIHLVIKREDEILNVTTETVEVAHDPNKAYLGILITTKNLNYSFPRQVDFVTEKIVGPSAGTMFTLEIYNQITKEDLSKGRRIAGTGTISQDGSIGKIDGVSQKVLAAEKEKAELFIVPIANYEEAKSIASTITLVPVKNIEELINYLNNN